MARSLGGPVRSAATRARPADAGRRATSYVRPNDRREPLGRTTPGSPEWPTSTAARLTGRSHLPTRAASITASDRSCPPRWISAQSRWTQFAECLREHRRPAVRLPSHYPGRQYRRNITGPRSSPSYRNSPVPGTGSHESQEDELTTQRRTAHAFGPGHTVATAAVRRPDGAGGRGPTLRPGTWSGSSTRRCAGCLRTSLGSGTVHARARCRGLRAPLR